MGSSWRLPGRSTVRRHSARRRRLEVDVDQVGLVVDRLVEGGPGLFAVVELGDGDEAPVGSGFHRPLLDLQCPEAKVEMGPRPRLHDELGLGRRRLGPPGGH